MALSDLAAVQLQKPDFFAIQATAYNAYAKTYDVPAANLGKGSSFGPFYRGTEQLALQLQDQVVIVGGVARLTTSSGADVDSFVNAFGFYRNGATNAGGQVVFSITNPVVTGLAVPLGTIVKTPANQQYVVVADTSQGTYVAPNPMAAVGTFAYTGGYQGAANTNTVVATIQAVLTGTANGNCDAGAISLVVSGPGTQSDPGLSVSNPLAFTSATDAESDADVIQRFQDFMAGTGNGTVLAICAAALAVQPGNLVVQVGNLKNQAGTYTRGFFSVFVNVQGTGVGPSSALLAAVGTAIGGTVTNGDQDGGVIAAGNDFGVYAPTLEAVSVAATCVLDGSVPAATVQAAAAAAVAAYINASGMSQTGSSTTVPYALIIGAMMVPGVAYVAGGATVNGGYADIVVGYGTQAVAGVITVATANE